METSDKLYFALFALAALAIAALAIAGVAHGLIGLNGQMFATACACACIFIARRFTR